LRRKSMAAYTCTYPTKGTEFTADTMVEENHRSTTAPTP